MKRGEKEVAVQTELLDEEEVNDHFDADHEDDPVQKLRIFG